MKRLFKALVLATILFAFVPTSQVNAFAFDPFDKYGKWLPWGEWEGAYRNDMAITMLPYNHYISYGYLSQNFARYGGDEATNGVPVRAISDGVVVEVGYDPYGWGSYVLLDHQNGYKTRYSHMGFLALNSSDIGKAIRQGQEIGTVGMTGNTNGHANLEFTMYDSRMNAIRATVDGRPFQGSYSWTWPQINWQSPVDNFDKYTGSVFLSTNDTRPNDPTNPWDPPVIDPLDRYLQNYGYLFPSGMIAEPVNTALGSFLNRSEDISFASNLGPQFKFERFYNSPDKFVCMNGVGWTNTFNIRIMAHDNFKYSIKFADGRGEIFSEPDQDKSTFNADFNRETPESTGTLHRYGSENGYKFYYVAQDQTVYTFNSDRDSKKWGKLEQIKSADGKVVNFGYDDQGNITKATDSFGRFMTFSFSGNLLQQITASDGRKVNYTYNFDGKLATVTKTDGGTWRYDYDASGQLAYIQDGAGKNFVSNTYDTAGRVISQADGNGGITKFEYGDEKTILGIATGNQITKITDPMGNVTQQINDSHKYLIKEIKPNGSTTAYEYNNQGKVIKKTLADGTVYTYAYDARGNQTGETWPNGYSKQTEYNAQNLPVKITDNAGNITYEYNSAGKITKSTNQQGKSKLYSYDNNNQLISLTDENGNVSTYTYDTTGLLAGESSGSSSLRYTYDAAGNKLSVTDANGGVTRFEYNGLGKVVKATDPKGNVNKFEYDGNGNLTAEIDAVGAKKVYKSDGNENITEIDYNVPRTDTITYSLQSEGDLITQDGTTADVYSQPGNLKDESWIGTGNNVTKSYLGLRLHGGMALPQNAKIVSASFELYNNHSQMENSYQWIPTAFDLAAEKAYNPADYTATSLPGARALTAAKASYKADEKWFKDTWWKIDVTNVLQELVSTGNSGSNISLIAKGTGTQWGRKFWTNFRTSPLSEQPRLVITYTITDFNLAKEKFEYDKNNNKISYTDRNGNVSKYTYDKNNNLIKTVNTDATGKVLATTTYEYDKQDRKTKETNGLGNSITYEYNNVGLLTKISQPCKTILCQDWRAKTYEYDALGRAIKESDFDGNTYTHEYDSLNRKVKDTNPNGNITTYSYDDVGNLIATTDALGNKTQSTYDANRNLIKVINAKGTESIYSYDSVGNLISQKNFSGEVSTFKYDANTNLITQTDALGNSTTFEYDSRNNLLSITDALGNKTRYGYDAIGNKVQEVNALGLQKQLAYDSNGNLIQMTGEDGNKTSFTYDGLNRQIAQTDQKGNATKYEFDLGGNLTKITDKNGNATTLKYNFKNELIEAVNALGFSQKYEYNKNGQLTKTTDAGGGITTFAYDKLGHRTSVVNALGNKQDSSYDALGRLSVQTDWAGNAEKYELDALGQITKLTDRAGNVKIFTYDNGGHVLKASDLDKSGSELRSTRYEYDALGRAAKQINPDGGTLQYVYDALSNVTSVTNPNGAATKYSYDALGRKLRQISPLDANGVNATTSYEYDAANRTTKVTDALGNSTAYAYDSAGNLLKVVNANGALTSFAYDNNGNLIKVTNAVGNATSYTYDKLNRQTKVTYANGTSTSNTYDKLNHVVSTTNQKGVIYKTSYDALGNVTAQIDPLNNTTKYEYDKNGNLVKQTTPEGQSTTYQYDNLAHLTKVVDALNNTSSYEYDSLGNLVTEINAAGNKTTNQYDLMDRLVSETNPTGAKINYAYDKVGNLTSKIKADGTVISYSYDNLGRLLSDSTGNNYTYDAIGNQVRAQNAAITTDFSYDNMQRITQSRDSNGAVVKYTYDLLGNRTGITYPNGDTATYEYDAMSRLTALNIGTDKTKFEYDQLGSLTKQINPNNTEVIKTYDAAERLTSVTNQYTAKVVNPVIASFKYTLNKNGDKLTEQYTQRDVAKVRTGTKTYQYDALQRITKVDNKASLNALNFPVVSEEFSYDKVGNMTKSVTSGKATNYNYNAAGELTSDTQYTYSYDANGNRVTKQGNGKNYTFTYDVNDQLTGVKGKVDNKDIASTYSYDALGRRVTKEDTTYTYDGHSWQSIVEQSANSTTNYYTAYVENKAQPTLIARVTYNKPNAAPDTKQDVPVLAPENPTLPELPKADIKPSVTIPDAAPTKNLAYYLRDGLGSVVAEVDKSANNFRDYSAFGKLTGGDIKNSNRTYSQKEYDSETGLYYYGSRYYDPESASWNKPDSYRGSISTPSTRQRYQFVQDNPVNNIDLWGFEPINLGYTNDPEAFKSSYLSTINTQLAVSNNVLASLNQSVSYWQAETNSRWWSAHFADIEKWNYITMEGIVGRLEARGYEMNYSNVYNYLGNKIDEKSYIFNVLQNSYFEAASNLDRYVNQRNALTLRINTLNANKLNADNIDWVGIITKANQEQERTLKIIALQSEIETLKKENANWASQKPQYLQSSAGLGLIGGLVVADGPLPIGDAIAVGVVVVLGIAALAQTSNTNRIQYEFDRTSLLLQQKQQELTQLQNEVSSGGGTISIDPDDSNAKNKKLVVRKEEYTFTDHAYNAMEEGKLTPTDVQNTIQNGEYIRYDNGTGPVTGYRTPDGTFVAVGDDNRIITVIEKTNSNYLQNILNNPNYTPLQ
jgi:RHS repeat-associated protein